MNNILKKNGVVANVSFATTHYGINSRSNHSHRVTGVEQFRAGETLHDVLTRLYAKSIGINLVFSEGEDSLNIYKDRYEEFVS